jgi:hypothetical protein
LYDAIRIQQSRQSVRLYSIRKFVRLNTVVLWYEAMMCDVPTKFDGVEKLHRPTFLAGEWCGTVYGDHDGGRVVYLQDSACELDTNAIFHAYMNTDRFSVGSFTHHDETQRVSLVLQTPVGERLETTVVQHFGARLQDVSEVSGSVPVDALLDPREPFDEVFHLWRVERRGCVCFALASIILITLASRCMSCEQSLSNHSSCVLAGWVPLKKNSRAYVSAGISSTCILYA